MKIVYTSLPGVLVVEPRIFEDKRGFFMETYQKERYTEGGIGHTFVQDNLSYSMKGTLRGLHYQLQKPQGKLVQAIQGEIFDVAVDIRRGSPSFGQWIGEYLSGENRRQLYIPEGYAHGFCVLSDTAYVMYKCTDFYAPHDEGGILWRDSGINIEWPVKELLLSDKDSAYPCLGDVPPERLPIYKGSD